MSNILEKTKAIAEQPVTHRIKSGVIPLQIIKKIVKLVVSGVLIVWILHSTNLAEIGESIRKANTWLLLLAFLLHLIGLLISALRWRMLIRSHGNEASILFLVKSYIVGMFFNNFLPSTIGGDVYRTIDSLKIGQSKSNALAIVFVDRFLGLLTLMLFALIALMNKNELTAKIPYLPIWIGLGTIAMLIVTWQIFMPGKWLPIFISKLRIPFSKKIAGILEAFMAFKGQGGVLVKALVLSALLQVNVVIHYYLISKSLMLPIPFLSFFLIIPLATVIMMLPISVNGIGIRENIYAFFFSAFGIFQAEAVAFAWIAYGMILFQGMVGAILYAIRR
jgi:uncharacterized protein (TIRG00374 family)